MRKRHRRRKYNKQKRIITLSLLLIMICLSIGYATFSTGINLNAKGNIKQIPITIDNLKTTIPTSGDGLYKDYTEDGRYVYKGTNPNNYITLGNDMYRIIAVEKDNTLKVVKNESVGSIYFDLIYNSNMAESVSQTIRYSSTNTDYCYQNSGETSQYYGCNVWGNNKTILDNTQNHIDKIIKVASNNISYNLPNTEAYINTYLNSIWYSTIDTDIQYIIVNHIFNIGAVEDNGNQSLDTTLKQEQLYKWQGKIGLINVTDYIKSNTNINECGTAYKNSAPVNNYNTCKTTNWIYDISAKNSLWTIAPYHNYVNHNWFISSEGYIGGNGSAGKAAVVPTFYLSSSIKLFGDGTAESSYKISK